MLGVPHQAHSPRPSFEPKEPVRVSAEESARIAAVGSDIRREIRERLAGMEVVLPAGHPIRAR